MISKEVIFKQRPGVGASYSKCGMVGEGSSRQNQ